MRIGAVALSAVARSRNHRRPSLIFPHQHLVGLMFHEPGRSPAPPAGLFDLSLQAGGIPRFQRPSLRSSTWLPLIGPPPVRPFAPGACAGLDAAPWPSKIPPFHLAPADGSTFHGKKELPNSGAPPACWHPPPPRNAQPASHQLFLDIGKRASLFDQLKVRAPHPAPSMARSIRSDSIEVVQGGCRRSRPTLPLGRRW